MKKLFMMFMTSVLALSLLVSCEESNKVNNTPKTKETDNTNVTKETEITNVTTKDINDLVTIMEMVNKEDVAPNGDKVRYVYEVPIIHIDKPGAQKINNWFLNLEKDMENRIGDGQNLTLFIKSKAFLNDGIISVVMEIKKPGPGGIYAANYDIKNDQEISTKELLAKYQFDPQKLIAEINRQEKINESKPEEERDYFGIDYFVDTVITNMDSDPSNDLNMMEDMKSKTTEEKVRYVIENIDNIKTYLNQDGKFVFIHRAALEDKELVVE